MKKISRVRRHKRVTKKIQGRTDMPRLVVFRSKKHISAQLIDDSQHKVLGGKSTCSKDFKGSKTSDVKAANELGKMIADQAVSLGVKTVSFDRGGYKYHGRVKAVADGAREGGLKF